MIVIMLLYIWSNFHFQMFKLDLEKAEEPEIKMPTTVGSLTTPKPLDMWITTKCGKFLKRWEY